MQEINTFTHDIAVQSTFTVYIWSLSTSQLNLHRHENFKSRNLSFN